MKTTINTDYQIHHRPSPTETKCSADGPNHMPNTVAADGLYQLVDRDTGLTVGTAYWCAECAKWAEDEDCFTIKIGEAN